VRGFELVDEISDPAVSGHTPLGEREGGRRLLGLVAAGVVQNVVAGKLDRLFRNALNCLQLVEVWTAQGGLRRGRYHRAGHDVLGLSSFWW
jgi:hypothetical protein